MEEEQERLRCQEEAARKAGEEAEAKAKKDQDAATGDAVAEEVEKTVLANIKCGRFEDPDFPPKPSSVGKEALCSAKVNRPRQLPLEPQ